MSDEQLLAAVRSGDAKAVAALLDAGADPDSADEHGTSVLCLAVDGFALPIVESLAPSAQVDRVAPDGRTALLRAIDLGAYDIVEVLISRGAKPYLKDSAGRDALALARHWHETGTEAELRRRTGRDEPIERRTVPQTYGTCTELSLDGLTVRDGHTAILTALEPRYGITASFEELLSRAVAEPDIDHLVWWATTYTLQKRRDPAVWEAAAALRDREDPLERYFGAELLRLIHLLDNSDDAPFDGPLVDLLLPWVARETDPRVTSVLAAGLGEAANPRAREPLPALTRHRDGGVRQSAVAGLHSEVHAGNPEALAAVLERTQDREARVRHAACMALRFAPLESSATSDALAACLSDEDEKVRITAAAHLALRDDPRGNEVLDALGYPEEDSPYYWLLYDVFRHRRLARHDPAGET